MNWKQNKGFIVGLGLSGAALAGISVFAFITSSAKGELESALEGKVSERQMLESAKIFPSMDHVRAVGAEVEGLRGFLRTMQDDIRSRQSAPIVANNPSDFNLRLEAERNALLKLAAETLVPVPGLEGEEAQTRPVTIGDKFWFDFDDYGLGGKTPELARIPLLSVQLQTLKVLCETLVRSGISELGAVERQKLENQAAAPAEPAEESAADRKKRGRKPGEPEAASVALSDFTCSLRFTAREDRVWAALTQLTNLPIPLVVTGVEVRNLNSTLQPAFGSPAAGAPAQVTLEDLARALGGRSTPSAARNLETAGMELVQVLVRFRVFRIDAPAPSPADSQPQGS